MNLAARYQDNTAAVLAVLGFAAFSSGLFWPGLALSLAGAVILTARRHLHQPRTWRTTLARILVTFGLFAQVYFMLTAPVAVTGL